MWEVVKKALIELLWPILKDVVKKYSRELIEWLVAKLKEWATSRNMGIANVASSKAEACETAAKAATSPAEEEKHEAVAKVWREVAEMFRQENEALSSELNRLRTQAEFESNKVIENLAFEDAVVEKDGKLEVANTRLLLPK